jgi:hypothetical protein
LTWLRHLDDDLVSFVTEVRVAIWVVLVAYHDDDLTELDQLVRDWRATADELADRCARRHYWARSPRTAWAISSKPTRRTRSGDRRLSAVSAGSPARRQTCLAAAL